MKKKSGFLTQLKGGILDNNPVLVQLLGQLFGGGGELIFVIVAVLGDLDLGGDHLVGGFYGGGGVVGIGHGWNIPFGFWSFKFGFVALRQAQI